MTEQLVPIEGAAPPAERILVALAHAARAAGVPVTADRTQAFLAAVALLDAGQWSAVRVAGHSTLCGSPEDLARFDRVLDAWIHDPIPLNGEPPTTDQPVSIPLPAGDKGDQPGEVDADVVHARASRAEHLAQRDVATMTPTEKAVLDAMIASLRPRAPRRRVARRTQHRRGDIDVRRTVRASLRRGGEPARLHRQQRRHQPRRIIFLLDVSASMKPYADALLRLAHAGVTARETGRVEVFTLGTRLTRISDALRSRDAERAMIEAGKEVPDWAGGTRLGETLEAFNQRWGARGVARGAVVVICSDGWEIGDAALLGEQVQRLHRLAHRVIWLNPHRGKDGYEPVQRGITAVLPHVDDFVAGHSLRSFGELLEVIADA